MSAGRIPTTANSPLTTKGDLFTYSTSPARLAVGANGEQIVADSSATTGLRWQGNYAAGKNKIINGDFNIWQRGTSSTTNGYLADRFQAAASGGTNTFSRQAFTAGTAPVAGYEAQYFHRIATSATATYFDIFQPIEDVRTFAGQTVTFSFWAKASSSVGVIPLLRQNFGSGGSANVDHSGSTMTFTSSWVRYSFTATLGSMSGKTIGTGSYLGAFFYYTSGTATSNNIDTWGWQVELGNTATAFQTATGTLQGELAACQRYYFRRSGTTNYMVANSAVAYSSTFSMAYIQPPVVMRTAPSSMDISNVSYVQYDEATTSLSSYLLNGSRSTESQIYIYASGTGMTAGRFGTWAINNTTGYLGFSAEL